MDHRGSDLAVGIRFVGFNLPACYVPQLLLDDARRLMWTEAFELDPACSTRRLEGCAVELLNYVLPTSSDVVAASRPTTEEVSPLVSRVAGVPSDELQAKADSPSYYVNNELTQ